MNQQKRKSRKKLLLTLGLLFGLAGVGTAAFAGYVISNENIQNPTDPTPGTIEVESRNYSLTGTIADDDKLYFYPENEVDSGNLLYEFDEDETKRFDDTLAVTVTTSGDTQELEGKAIQVTVSDKTVAETQSAFAKNYIALPSPNNQKQSYSTGKNEYIFEFKFDWGSTFEGKDPCSHFNTGTGSEMEKGDSEDTAEDNTINGIMNDFKTALAATVIHFEIELVAA